MHRSLRWNRFSLNRLATVAIACQFLLPVIRPSIASAQGAMQTGSIGGKVTDERGAPIAGAQVGVQGTTAGAQTGTNGEYVIARVAAGAQTVRVRMLGFRPDSASVTVAPDQRASQPVRISRCSGIRCNCRTWS
jgi:hypothetical protein